MLVVAQQTFAWGSLRVLAKIPRNDALVIVGVTVITVFTDLAIAVLCGIVIAALNFAWQHAREIRADVKSSSEGTRTYALHGTLFFASTASFADLFAPPTDPAEVNVDCQHLHVADHSAIAAFETLKGRYEKAGRRLRFINLSLRNRHILERAGVTVINARPNSLWRKRAK